EKSPAAQTAKPPANIAPFLKLPAAERKPDQSEALLQWYRTIDAEWKKLNQQVQEHTKQAPQPAKVLISTEGLQAIRLHTQGGDFFNESHFLRRGGPGQTEGVAAPGFLQVLMPAADAENRWQTPPPAGWRTSYRRRALAEWLTDVDNGAGRLLARVIVNRLWQHHMSRGVVATPNGFGTRGEGTKHPELLGWLAPEMIPHEVQLIRIHTAG